ncbi:hypothetical protein QA645_32245 [Bradyrhizobium sp. CIAT3101]|uniref:hypothetical protein n=1 Tax=Bradyrhizobium sp. CIAT3101 TaxID=439387 RepID=UPI0024B156A6|nr:hypothetical protein [Bradyrhizobium sp. CIAT3101]WFU79168.1 hypothetical protein QA645_32245 [Bradyrhizobium sp. CIAT3101]
MKTVEVSLHKNYLKARSLQEPLPPRASFFVLIGLPQRLAMATDANQSALSNGRPSPILAPFVLENSRTAELKSAKLFKWSFEKLTMYPSNFNSLPPFPKGKTPSFGGTEVIGSRSFPRRDLSATLLCLTFTFEKWASTQYQLLTGRQFPERDGPRAELNDDPR